MSTQDHTDRYISIARACLKAINDTSTGSTSREEKIQAVYQAIDDAFQAELADQRQAVAVMASVLERIATGSLSAEEATTLARITLDQHPTATSQGQMH